MSLLHLNMIYHLVISLHHITFQVLTSQSPLFVNIRENAPYMALSISCLQPQTKWFYLIQQERFVLPLWDTAHNQAAPLSGANLESLWMSLLLQMCSKVGSELVGMITGKILTFMIVSQIWHKISVCVDDGERNDGTGFAASLAVEFYSFNISHYKYFKIMHTAINSWLQIRH